MECLQIILQIQTSFLIQQNYHKSCYNHQQLQGMQNSQTQQLDETIENLLRAKLHIEGQTQKIFDDLCKQYNAEDPFCQLSKRFAQKNKLIQNLTAQNKHLIQQNRRLKSSAHLNQSYNPINPIEQEALQQRQFNQKMSQSLVQNCVRNNSLSKNQTQFSLDSNLELDSLNQAMYIVNVARSQNSQYTRNYDAFLIYLIQTINELSIKKNTQNKFLPNFPISKQIQQGPQKMEEQHNDQTVNISIDNYKKLIEVYCLYMGERSTCVIIPSQLKPNQQYRPSVDYKKLLQNLQIQNPNNFQSIFSVISIKLGLFQEWKNFIHRKQEQYAQIYQDLANIIDEKLQFNLRNIKLEAQKVKKDQEEQLFAKLAKIVRLDCLKFTPLQKNLWEKHQLKRNWFDLQFFLQKLNSNTNTQTISAIVQQLHFNMFSKCLQLISNIVCEKKLSTSKNNQVLQILKHKHISRIDSLINDQIKKLVSDPSQKQKYFKQIKQLQNEQFQFVQKFINKHTYFYAGINPELCLVENDRFD